MNHWRTRLWPYRSQAAEIIRPPPNRSAAEWADAKRILPPESPEPGRWRTSRIPYFIPIMERFSDPTRDLIVIVCGAQMGKTEAMMCVAGHRLDDGPYVPLLWIAPTQKSVKSLADDRFTKMLRSTPDLWAKLEKGRRNRVVEKFVGGVRVGFGWAGSATELASHPAGLVLVDERDRMLSDVEGEGDPLTLARARTKNYALRKIGVSSTPTLEGGSPIWSLFLEGTREKWGWICPHCHGLFIPQLSLLKWPDDATPNEARQHAYLECPNCGGEILDRHKPNMNATGRFVPHIVQSIGGEDKELPINFMPDNSTASYWISGLASPWQTFGEIAEMLVQAYRSREPERIQGVVNTYGGEIWRMRGEAPAHERVLDTRSQWAPRQVPPWVQLITCGVDVQKDGLYWGVRGWGFNAQSLLLDNGFLWGNTEYDSVWTSLAGILTRPIGDRTIDRVFVDSGYKPGKLWRRPENVIYAFARRHRGLVFPSKGHAEQDKPIKASHIDVHQGGKIIKNGVKLWHLDTDHLKTWLYSRIEWPEGEPGAWLCHNQITEEFAKQVTNEEVVVKASGRRVWIEKGANHYLDVETLAYAAALSLNVYALPEQKTSQVTPQLAPGATSHAAAGRFNRREL